MDLLRLDRDLEARKHLARGMARLGPKGWTAFLAELCRLVSRTQHGAVTRVAQAPRTAYEAYMDCLMLAAVHGLDLNLACQRLEEWLRRQ